MANPHTQHTTQDPDLARPNDGVVETGVEIAACKSSVDILMASGLACIFSADCGSVAPSRPAMFDSVLFCVAGNAICIETSELAAAVSGKTYGTASLFTSGIRFLACGLIARACELVVPASCQALVGRHPFSLDCLNRAENNRARW